MKIFAACDAHARNFTSSSSIQFLLSRHSPRSPPSSQY
jgi:hypothetical protein